MRTDIGLDLVRYLLLAMVAAGLAVSPASVRGADESEPTGATNATPTPRAYFLQPGDVVLFLGNSITEGAQPEMNFLAEDFRKKYPKLAEGKGQVQLITAGIGGEQAVAGAGRLKALLDQHKPTVCVVCYGTCEVVYKGEENFTPAMKDIVRQLKKARVAITVVSPPPAFAKNWKQGALPVEQLLDGIPRMVKEAKSIAAAEKGAIFVDAFAAFKAAAAKSKKELTSDGIHPNEGGYRVMTDALQKAWGFGSPLGSHPSRRSPRAGKEGTSR